MEGDRIAKVIARAGLCSRRDAERWIAEGRVSVDGKIITSPALNVSHNNAIVVDGKPLKTSEAARLWLFHKPAGVMTTHRDPEGRKTVFEMLPPEMGRVISIGRLDYNTEGLLLLTNSGELAHTLENPKTGWMRRYRVRVYGTVPEEKLESLKNGASIRDPKTGEYVKYGPIEAAMDHQGAGRNHWLNLAISEGKNREVRNICRHLSLEVSRLIRVAYGPFQLGQLKEGEVSEVPTHLMKAQLGELMGESV